MFQEYYQDKMNRLENEANYWIGLANAEYAKNNAHTKQEVLYKQHAATIISQMANESIGAAKDYQKHRLADLNKQIRDDIMTFDPDFFTRTQKNGDKDDKKTSSNSNNTGAKGSDKNNGATISKNNQVDEETKKRWHKPIPTTTFENDVQGMEKEKEQLIACAKNVGLASLMDYLEIDKNQAFLLYGPPGTGKTHLVRAFVHELSKLDSRFQYLSLEGADILSKYVGDAESIVRAVFEEAIACAPCIVFIDELDGVCKNRSMKNLPEYASSITTSFLTGYNSLDTSKEQIIFIGATNYPANIDKAMVDRVSLISVSYPDAEPRIGVFKHAFGDKIALTDGFTYEQIGEITEPKTEEICMENGEIINKKTAFNHRDLKKLCNTLKIAVMKEAINKYGEETAALNALKSGEFGVNRELFEKTLAENPPQDHSRADREIEFFENGGWDADD